MQLGLYTALNVIGQRANGPAQVETTTLLVNIFQYNVKLEQDRFRRYGAAHFDESRRQPAGASHASHLMLTGGTFHCDSSGGEQAAGAGGVAARQRPAPTPVVPAEDLGESGPTALVEKIRDVWGVMSKMSNKERQAAMDAAGIPTGMAIPTPAPAPAPPAAVVVSSSAAPPATTVDQLAGAMTTLTVSSAPPPASRVWLPPWVPENPQDWPTFLAPTRVPVAVAATAQQALRTFNERIPTLSRFILDKHQPYAEVIIASLLTAIRSDEKSRIVDILQHSVGPSESTSFSDPLAAIRDKGGIHNAPWPAFQTFAEYLNTRWPEQQLPLPDGPQKKPILWDWVREWARLAASKSTQPMQI